MIPAITSTTVDLGYNPLVINDIWDKEAYRLYALRQLEIIGVMPQTENVIDFWVLRRLIEEEMGAEILYETDLFLQNQAWGYVRCTRWCTPEMVMDAKLRCGEPILKRTTAAHELGHLFLHKDVLEQGALSRSAAYKGTYVSEESYIIGEEDMLRYTNPLPSRPYHVWTEEEIREFQANQFMVGVLLPSFNLRRYIANFFQGQFILCQKRGWSVEYALRVSGKHLLAECIKSVAVAFNVSKQMAAIECGRLWHSLHDRDLFRGKFVLPEVK